MKYFFLSHYYRLAVADMVVADMVAPRLKRRVCRRRLKVSKVGESLILSGSPFQTYNLFRFI